MNAHEYQLNQDRAKRKSREKMSVLRLINMEQLEKEGDSYVRKLADDTDLSVGKVNRIIEEIHEGVRAKAREKGVAL